MKKILSTVLVIGSLFLFTRCSKDNDDSNSRKVEYKVISAFSNITSVTYTDVDGNDKVISAVPAGANYTSGALQIPNSVSTLKVIAKAPGGGGTNLIVQIFVDGELKKEVIETGVPAGVTTATATY